MKGTLIHTAQYSSDDDVYMQSEASFWRGDGYIVKMVLHQTEHVWTMYVYERGIASNE